MIAGTCCSWHFGRDPVSFNYSPTHPQISDVKLYFSDMDLQCATVSVIRFSLLHTVHYWTANEKFSVIALIYSRTYSILEFYLSLQVDLQLFYSVLVLSFGKLWNMAVLFSTAIETIYVIEEMICSRTPDVGLIFVLRRYNVTFTHFWRWNIELRESTMCMFVSVNVAGVGEGCWNKAK